jgi:pimeloyl-ACP methyl ester carboxylesterase
VKRHITVMSVLISLVASASVTLASAPSALATPAAAEPAFYSPPSPLPQGRNGDLIRDEQLSTSVDLGGVVARAQRIMYLSRDAQNRRIAVTGAVLTPSLPWLGAGPRPLVGYAMGTQGMADRCAPSRQLSELGLEYEVPNLLQLLLHGYGVVVTDYQGLGAPGVHTYLNPIAEAHAVLDSIRAAQRLPAAGMPDSGPVGIMGYSQGGGAAGASAELQPTYAAELDVKGVYAGGVVADPTALMAKLNGSLAAGLASDFLTGLQAAYSDLRVDEFLNEKGKQVAAATADECWHETVVNHALLSQETLTEDGRSFAAHLAEPPFKAVLSTMVLGRSAPTAPVLVLQGPLDELVPHQEALQMAGSWCKKGTNVRFENLLVPEHIAASYEAFIRAEAWLADRFAGKPATSNCGAL